MNAGAYGGEVKDCIDYALCVNEQGSLIKLTTKELELDYRNSIIQKNTQLYQKLHLLQLLVK